MGLKPKREFGEKWQFRDPAEVLDRARGIAAAEAAKTCAGCRHILKSPIRGDPAIACNKRMRRPSMSVEESRKCEIHEEGKAK